MLIEDEEFIVTHKYTSMTDPAFVNFVSTLVFPLYGGNLIADVGLQERIRNIAGHGRTIMVQDVEIHRAFKVFTKQPMKFLVQYPNGIGGMGTEEVAIFWHDDVEPKGQWDTRWEYMSKALAGAHYRDANYRFEGDAKDFWGRPLFGN